MVLGGRRRKRYSTAAVKRSYTLARLRWRGAGRKFRAAPRNTAGRARSWARTKMSRPGAPVDFETDARIETWLAISKEPGTTISGRNWRHLRQAKTWLAGAVPPLVLSAGVARAADPSRSSSPTRTTWRRGRYADTTSCGVRDAHGLLAGHSCLSMTAFLGACGSSFGDDARRAHGKRWENKGLSVRDAA
jgi:hypothetical protein